MTHSVVFGSALTADAEWRSAHPVIRLLPGSIEIAESAGAGAEETVEVPAASGNPATITNRERIVGGERPEDSLGAAVGASRAAVDSGYYPHHFQVGQAGKGER